jgi:predicted ATP-dependent endonuclease of OLD family
MVWRLQTIMTPWMNEGFFAQVIVLVEGEEDRAAILEVAASMGHDLDSMGIAVIPCFGKPNLDRPALVFQSLGIPTYLVWDNDRGKQSEARMNRRLLKLLELPEEDWPQQIGEKLSCFEVDLDTTLKTEIGEANYESLFSMSLTKFEVDRGRRVEKNPVILREIIRSAVQSGTRIRTMEQIVERIIALRNS